MTARHKAKRRSAARSVAGKPATASPPRDAESTEGAAAFPVVGIGASAGGLAALEAFLSAMPPDIQPGMAFVLVQHLAPDHKSLLTEIIRRYTRMDVFDIEEGMLVRPNCTYVIPPDRDLALHHGALHLLGPSSPRGQRLPIDFFFRSLAQDVGDRAIGIVLSGTGSDGTQGVRAIKGEGGMVMAQDPATTEFDGMPRSAIATGLVDFVLDPAHMAERLLAFAEHAFVRGPTAPATADAAPGHALEKIFALLRAATGHDFSEYKPSTVRRRIERRMALQEIEDLDAYLKYLQRSPTEVNALFADLLIGVTRFFRDPEAFAALEHEVIPRLFEDRPKESTVRVWIPGCSTGEEAYSIAMLLREHLDRSRHHHTVQIFATDIDAQAIGAARAGVYPAGIAADVSPERLARFFTEDAAQGFRVRKDLRDVVIFSEQDVLRDPPFSRIDLVSCRNLLIYLSGEVQKQVIPLFHYALNPGGFLFLGSSESAGDDGELFAVVDRKWKIYRRRESLRASRGPRFDRIPALTAAARALGPPRAPMRPRPPARELAEQALLRHLAPVGILVDGDGDVLYLHGHAGLFLEPSAGEVGTANVVRMARPGLGRALTTALHRARTSKEVVRAPGVEVKTNGHFSRVDVTVRPVPAPGDTMAFLVILEETGAAAPGAPAVTVETPSPEGDAEPLVAALRRELRAKEEYLQVTVEELETANEELRSSNEEMQSMNEEMQSTNEELETSKEELQSVNEELATVNAELQIKVADLSRANNDMNNLLAGTGIATVFIDHQLLILRFTPAATRLINLIPSDIGRPLGHVASNLVGYTTLAADARSVLDTLTPAVREVRTEDGRWYSMRIQPYRSLENVVEGAVITFVDVTEVTRAREALSRNQTILQTAEAIIHFGGFDYDVALGSMLWTPEVYRLLELAEDAVADKGGALARGLEGFAASDRVAVETALHRCVEAGEPFDLTLPYRTGKGRHRRMCVAARATREGDQVVRVVGFWLDVTGAERTPEDTP